jgi:K+-transporting ATPase KdpF subunit
MTAGEVAMSVIAVALQEFLVFALLRPERC